MTVQVEVSLCQKWCWFIMLSHYSCVLGWRFKAKKMMEESGIETTPPASPTPPPSVAATVSPPPLSIGKISYAAGALCCRMDDVTVVDGCAVMSYWHSSCSWWISLLLLNLSQCMLKGTFTMSQACYTPAVKRGVPRKKSTMCPHSHWKVDVKLIWVFISVTFTV